MAFQGIVLFLGVAVAVGLVVYQVYSNSTNANQHNSYSNQSHTYRPPERKPQPQIGNTKRRRRNSNSSNHNSCIICMENITLDNTKTLRCSHSFHKTCIDSWISLQRSCPLCREGVV